MKRKKEAIRAFTLIEVAVIVVCVALMAVMVIESMTRSSYPSNAPRAQCQNNLKQIGLAYREWEGDYSDRYPQAYAGTATLSPLLTQPWSNSNGINAAAVSNIHQVFQVMSNELNNPKIVVCPADNRNQAIDFVNFDNRNVSYFVGLDADETFPALPLGGDRNVWTNGGTPGTGIMLVKKNDVMGWTTAIHKSAGNILLSDGSVQQVNAAELQKLFQDSGTNLNRLGIP